MTRVLVDGTLALGWSSLLVSGAVLFEEGEWLHTVVAWGMAALMYGVWRLVRRARRREAR